MKSAMGESGHTVPTAPILPESRRPNPGIPPGTGRYKVLQLIDDNSPGNIGWDQERFS
jgi:hypothetical protein